MLSLPPCLGSGHPCRRITRIPSGRIRTGGPLTVPGFWAKPCTRPEPTGGERPESGTGHGEQPAHYIRIAGICRQGRHMGLPKVHGPARKFLKVRHGFVSGPALPGLRAARLLIPVHGPILSPWHPAAGRIRPTAAVHPITSGRRFDASGYACSRFCRPTVPPWCTAAIARPAFHG